MRWEGHVAYMGQDRKVYKILTGKPKGKWSCRRPRHRWEDGIKLELGKIGWGVEWIHLAQNRDHWQALVNAVMNLQVLAPHS
jgi:hypothetical protein